MSIVSQSWQENCHELQKEGFAPSERTEEKLMWCDSSLWKHTKMIQLYSSSTAVPLMCHLTRIIICSSKQALNQNKFHPPSKQPIATHLPPFLPPFLKQPSRSILWPNNPYKAHGSWERRPAGLLCRFWRQTSSTKRTGQTQAIIARKRGRDMDRDSQSKLHTVCLLNSSPGRPHAQLWFYPSQCHLCMASWLNQRL